MGGRRSGLAVAGTDKTESIEFFDAMERKETYATTGTRITVRFFGGWDFVAEDANTRRPAQVGYGKGVPMGGDLVNAPEGKAPTFLVAALKDPIGANLDRVQIVKGWIDADGNSQERVYDVAWGDADTRQPGADGKLPSVGTTVNVAEASYQHHWRSRTDHRLVRSRVRPCSEGVLLCSCDRNPYAALDRLCTPSTSV